MVHKYNSYILLQLAHPGLYSTGGIIYSPSVNKSFVQEKYSVEMTKDDILRIQNYFVDGAIRAEKAGFDGIQIHGAHLTLISTFLSPNYNKRTDEYGGSDENRARFLVEILKNIRKKVRNEFILSVKIDCEGENITESGFLTTAKMAEEAGIDTIELSGTNPIKNEDIYYFEATKKLAENVKIPVTYIGGVKTYEQADFVLKNSKIEYVSIVRALIKEPDLAKKWKESKN